MKGMGLDSRIGMQFLQAGLGYGGSCFPKDVDSLIHTAAQLGYDFKLLRVGGGDQQASARRTWSDMMRKGARAGSTTRRSRSSGLAFKPNTDDMREAKSLEVVRLLHAAGAQVRAYDPVGDGQREAAHAGGRRLQRVGLRGGRGRGRDACWSPSGTSSST